MDWGISNLCLGVALTHLHLFAVWNPNGVGELTGSPGAFELFHVGDFGCGSWNFVGASVLFRWSTSRRGGKAGGQCALDNLNDRLQSFLFV